jgi:hypothetical protein
MYSGLANGHSGRPHVNSRWILLVEAAWLAGCDLLQVARSDRRDFIHACTLLRRNSARFSASSVPIRNVLPFLK